AVQEYQSDLPASWNPKWGGSPGSLVALVFDTGKLTSLPTSVARQSKLSGNPGGQTGVGVNAMLVSQCEAMATTFVSPIGTFVFPELESPQATTVPSLFSAML